MPQIKKKRKALFASILVLSLLANVVLLVLSYAFFSEMRDTYGNYRHFRALPVGVSVASNAEPTSKSVVLFGDSRIETWFPAPEIDGYTIVNAGVSGETTVEMRKRFEHDVLRLQPEYVVLQAGMNDLTAAVTRTIPSPEKYAPAMHQNLAYFISTLTSNNIKVLVTSIIPNNKLNLGRQLFWRNTLNTEVDKANIKLKATALSMGAAWLDLDPLYLDSNDQPVQSLYRDTLHINDQGYAALNKTVGEYFSTLRH